MTDNVRIVGHEYFIQLRLFKTSDANFAICSTDLVHIRQFMGMDLAYAEADTPMFKKAD